MKRTKLNIALFVIILIVYSCEEQNHEPGIVARVNESILTEKQLEFMMDSDRFSNKNREDLIKEWVKDEVLFSQAYESGILDSEEYNELKKMTSRQVAISLLLKQVINQFEIDLDDDRLKEYYEKYLLDFRISDDAFVFNVVSFNDENRAISFRNELLIKNWESVVGYLDTDSDGVDIQERAFKYSYNLYPSLFSKSLKKMIPGEISVVLKVEPSKYSVVQMISKFSKGDIPEFEYIKPVVAERYKLVKQKQIYNEYFNNIYSKQNIEINKDYE